MVATPVVEATPTRVLVRGKDGREVGRARGDFTGASHGVNLDEVEHALEGMGYVAGHWRWQDNGAYWKAIAIPESAFDKYKAKGAANQRAAADYYAKNPAELAKIRALRERNR